MFGPLHSTMFLLILILTALAMPILRSLHSTMFLLILTKIESIQSKIIFTFHNVSINTTSVEESGSLIMFFTFHNVSINTIMGNWYTQGRFSLHSTMFLLIQSEDAEGKALVMPLHSTMFLLIRGGCKIEPERY